MENISIQLIFIHVFLLYISDAKENEEKYVISFDTALDGLLPEKTHEYNASNPKEVSINYFGKYKSIIYKRKSQNTRLKKSLNISNDYEYNYEELRQEYYNETANIGLSLNHTGKEKPQEISGESVDSILDGQDPDNCKHEEDVIIGITAIKCLWKDYSKDMSPQTRNKLLKRAFSIFSFWILIFLLVAIYLWCMKGWCCCCCRCEFCFPRKVVLKAKRFLYENKPGDIVLPSGEKEFYEATKYEIESYKEIERMIKNF